MFEKRNLKEAAKRLREKYDNMPGAAVIPYNPGSERDREILPDGSVYVACNYGDAAYSDWSFVIVKTDGTQLISASMQQEIDPILEQMRSGETAEQIEAEMRQAKK